MANLLCLLVCLGLFHIMESNNVWSVVSSFFLVGKCFKPHPWLCTHHSSLPFHYGSVFHCVAGLYCPLSVSASLDCAHSSAAVNAHGQLLCGPVAHFLVSPWEEPAGQMLALCLTVCNMQLFPPTAAAQCLQWSCESIPALHILPRGHSPQDCDGSPCGFEVKTCD